MKKHMDTDLFIIFQCADMMLNDRTYKAKLQKLVFEYLREKSLYKKVRP